MGSGTNWSGLSLNKMYNDINGGAGYETTSQSAGLWSSVAAELQYAADEVRSILASTTVEWSGAGSDAMVASHNQFDTWAEHARELSNRADTAAATQASLFTDTKPKISAPGNADANRDNFVEKGIAWIPGVTTDQEKFEEGERSKHAAAVAAMQSYDDSVYSGASRGYFSSPPVLVASVAPASAQPVAPVGPPQPGVGWATGGYGGGDGSYYGGSGSAPNHPIPRSPAASSTPAGMQPASVSGPGTVSSGWSPAGPGAPTPQVRVLGAAPGACLASPSSAVRRRRSAPRQRRAVRRSELQRSDRTPVVVRPRSLVRALRSAAPMPVIRSAAAAASARASAPLRAPAQAARAAPVSVRTAAVEVRTAAAAVRTAPVGGVRLAPVLGVVGAHTAAAWEAGIAAAREVGTAAAREVPAREVVVREVGTAAARKTGTAPVVALVVPTAAMPAGRARVRVWARVPELVPVRVWARVPEAVPVRARAVPSRAVRARPGRPRAPPAEPPQASWVLAPAAGVRGTASTRRPTTSSTSSTSMMAG